MPNSNLPIYKNPAAALVDRVSDLLSRMTTDEKIDQMLLGQDYSELIARLDNGSFPENGVSSVYVQGAPIEELNRIQRHNMENTRLGIPMLVAGESIHGLMCPGATVFPQAIGLGATFNKDLMAEIADIIGKEAAGVGIRQTYAPNIDLSRDPRWGRTEENYGEDPYLTARLCAAYIKKVQEHGVACTPKHYIAYGSPEGGLNIAPAHVGERELRENMLEPFRAAISEAGAMSLMPSYGEIDGVPVHASRYLMTDILRGELGFEGFTVSDYSALSMLYFLHHAAETPLEAGKMALHAGIDLEAPTPDAYGEDFRKAVKRGEIPMEEIDLAVSRILRVKFRLGLFEHPYIEADGTKHLRTEAAVQKARETAQESVVLLKNDGVLPIRNTIKKAAVVGPNSDAIQLGDYSAPFAGDNGITLRKALEYRLGAENVLYARGSGMIDASPEERAAAVEAAEAADITFVVLGDNSNFFGGIGWGDDGLGAAVTSGEGFDLAELILPESQRILLRQVAAAGKPVVLILETGRPYCIGEEVSLANAVLEAWYPGEQGGNALCDILFGDVSPSGRLPITFPRTSGQLPCFYNHKPSARGYYHKPGTPEQPGRDYVFDSPEPLYAFGYGLSYTTFVYSDIKAEPDEESGSAEISVTVTNTGDREAKHAVLLFLKDCVCRITPYVKRLRGFEKIFLKPGASQRVTFCLSEEDFCFINEKMQPEIEHGAYIAEIGDQTVEFCL